MDEYQSQFVDAGEYTLKEPAPGYHNFVQAIMLNGVVAFVMGFSLLGLYSISAPSYLFCLFSAGLLLSLSWLAYSFISGRKRFPDWREYHEKILPPKENPNVLKEPLLLPVAIMSHKIDRVFSYFFLLIGIGLTLLGFSVEKDGTMLLVLGSVTAAICLWNIRSLQAITKVEEEAVVRADKRGISFPLSSLETTSAISLIRNGKSALLLEWISITEWKVESGGSEDPDLYEISSIDCRTIQVSRGTLKGREIPLLEYARAAGVTITLKDSIRG